METAKAYKPSRSQESWEKVQPCGRLSNTYQDLGQNRCGFNVALQFLTGIPHIEQGLQNTFLIAGKNTRLDIQELWENSLTRQVVNAIGHVKSVAATDRVGDLKWFVEELGDRFPAMQDVVQWRDRKRGVLVQQDAEQVLQDLFEALADESSTVLQYAFPELRIDEAASYFSTTFSRVMRSSTSCPNGKECGAGSVYETGSITPVLKVGLGEAQFGLEPVTFAQIWKGFLYSSTNACSACLNLPRPVSSQLVTTDTLQVAPQVLILIFGREQPEIQGVSSRSKVAVMLQEEVALSYGTQKQHYLVRQYMFHTGVGSSGGHFTVAVREQQDGKYKEGDKWRYLDSARPVQYLSFIQLVHSSPTTVYAALLVAKTQPQDDPRPMLVAPPAPRALQYVPWESEPRTPPGSPAYGALAADYTSDEWGCDGWQQAHPTGEGHRKAFQPAALAPPSPRPTSGSHGHGNKGNGKKPSIGSSSGQEFSLPAYIANAGKTADSQPGVKTNTQAFIPISKSISNPKPVRFTPTPRTADSPMRVVESITSSQEFSLPAFIVSARKTTDSQPAVTTKPQYITPKPTSNPRPVRPTPPPFLKAGPKPSALKASSTPMSSPAPPPTSKTSIPTNATAIPQSMPPSSPAPTPQAGLTPTTASILKAGPMPEKVPAAKVKGAATKKVKLAAPLVKPLSPPPPSLSSPSKPLDDPAPTAPATSLSSSPPPALLSSPSHSSSSSLPPPPPSIKPSTTDLLQSPRTSSSHVSGLPASTNASAPSVPAAARKAKPGRSQRKKQAEREAKLSQQAPAAQQTGFSSSVAGLKPTSDQAKSAAVPASNQPQIVSPLQPTSKAVQSSGVAAGVGTQPPLVELASVETTTATELVVTPDAGVKPVKKQAAIPTETPGASTGAFSSPAPPSASAGVVKLNATQHRKRQRQHQKQKAADAAAADLPPASDPAATLADSQSQALNTLQTGLKPDASAGTSAGPSATPSAAGPKLPTPPSSPHETSSPPPPTNPLVLTTPPTSPKTSSPPSTTDPEASTSAPSSSKDSESTMSPVGPRSPSIVSSTTAPPPTPTETPDASSTPAPPSASNGVVKLSATQHRNRQRRNQRQKAADAAAADLPPASAPAATFADSQSQATQTPQAVPKPSGAAGTSLASTPSPTLPTSPPGDSSLPITTDSRVSTTPPSSPKNSSPPSPPPSTTDPEGSTSPPSNPKQPDSPLSTVSSPSPSTTSSTTGPPPPASNTLTPVPHPLTSATIMRDLVSTPTPTIMRDPVPTPTIMRDPVSTSTLTSTSSLHASISSSTSASSTTSSTSSAINPTSSPITPTSPPTTPSTASINVPKSQMSVDTEPLTGPAAVSPPLAGQNKAVSHGRPDTPQPGLDPTELNSETPLSPFNHMTVPPGDTAVNSSRESSAGSRRPNNPADHAGPGKKCIVMSVAIPVLAGACILGAGLLFGPRVMGKFSSVKTSMLSWMRH